MGDIDLGGNDIVKINRLYGSAHHSNVDDIVTSSSNSSNDLNIAVFDSTSGRVIKDSGVQISSLTGALLLTGGTMLGSINLNGNSLTNVSILSGPTNSRTADNIVSNAGVATSGRVATFSGASGKIITDGGVLLSNLLTTSAAASTYLALAGGNMTGAIDSTSTLDLGINLASSVNIGRSSAVTTVNGIFVTPLPKAAWYSLAGVAPAFTANVFRSIPLLVDNSQGLVEFKVNNANGNLTYTGNQTRTFVYTCNLNIGFTTPSTLSITHNINTVTGFTNSATGLFWDASILASRRLPFHISDQVVLSPGDTLILVGRWGNTSASQVIFGRCSFQIAALPN